MEREWRVAEESREKEGGEGGEGGRKGMTTNHDCLLIKYTIKG